MLHFQNSYTVRLNSHEVFGRVYGDAPIPQYNQTRHSWHRIILLGIVPVTVRTTRRSIYKLHIFI